jgi:hypothetical protein
MNLSTSLPGSTFSSLAATSTFAAMWRLRGDGVTRATRVAKLLPGILVRVEVIDDLPIPVKSYPSVGDGLP